jgi:HEAT repeat protein
VPTCATKWSRNRPRKRWGVVPRAALAVLLVNLCGCANFWDQITSRDFKVKMLFEKKDPLVVLRDSDNGDDRARAIQKLKEPKANGGNDEAQNLVLDLLIKSATVDRQPLCRLAAVEMLGHFQDPRAVPALQDAFYLAQDFPEEMAARIQCQALTSLGETRNPAAVKFLIEKLKEPPAERSDLAQQRSDRCTAAARALAHFQDPQAVQALTQVLRREKNDMALRNRVHEALVANTGQKLPADAQAWDDYLHSRDAVASGEEKPRKVKLMGWLFP